MAMYTVIFLHTPLGVLPPVEWRHTPESGYFSKEFEIGAGGYRQMFGGVNMREGQIDIEKH